MRRSHFRLLIALALLLLAATALLPRYSTHLLASNPQPLATRTSLRGPEPTYRMSAGLQGEIFPAFANYASMQPARDREFGIVNVTITNSTDSLLQNRVTVQLPGWSDQEIQAVTLAAGEVRTLLFAPSFYQRLYSNREITGATAEVTVADKSGKVVFHETAPVRLRSVDDMYWGKDFKFAPFIASWVTPHDPTVEDVLSTAKEFMPGRRLPGYESWKNPEQQKESTLLQAKAIYRALQLRGVSYVKSSITFGRHQDVSERVRMPAESVARSSANCIDGSVMYASLFENLGMEPVIVLFPGHAYVGVREAQGQPCFLYIETSITGRAPFEKAVQSAQNGIAKVKPADVIQIQIAQSRDAGIYPMPLPESPSAETRISSARPGQPAGR